MEKRTLKCEVIEYLAEALFIFYQFDQLDREIKLCWVRMQSAHTGQ